jgi:hypothetical protein
MELETKDLIIEGNNEGEYIDFKNVSTISDLKEKIIDNYVTLCRNCAFEEICKLKPELEIPCPLLSKMVENFIITNINTIDVSNTYKLKTFIELIISLIRFFNNSLNFLGIYTDDYFNQYFKSAHPSLNSIFGSKILEGISIFISNFYKIIEFGRIKEIKIFVEGKSEFEGLPKIFSEFGLFSSLNARLSHNLDFINMEGKDRIQKNKIEYILNILKKANSDCFIIIDNDENVKQYVDDLIRSNLIERNHILIWQNKFEDNFEEEFILKALQEEDSVFNNIDLNELKEENSKRKDIEESINYLLKINEYSIKFADYKVSLANRISLWICKELKASMIDDTGAYNGSREPKSVNFEYFINQIKPIVSKIKEIITDFHIVTSN